MNEFDGQAPGTAGSLLRQAREAAGLHIAALAVALKVPVKKLEALEADRLDLLPDAVFVRALASSVCRNLKIDASEVLALLPQTGKPRLDYPHASINTPFRSPSDGPGPSLLAQLSRPAVLAGLLLLLGALVLIFLPAVQQQNMRVQSTAEPLPAVAPTGMQPAPGSPPPAFSAPQAVGSDNPTISTPVADAAPTMATGMAVVSALSSGVVGPAAVSALPVVAPAPAGGVIVFTAKGESWVEVTDAKRVVVLRRTLTAGEVAGASGALPLSAVVGRADATQVQVRGRPFDLNAVSKDNVARFEVK
ncbi:helix-turn-helix domain-containing protein [Polaromonas sp.]|uniref:helix-turn-helix domain-containing protein n=1 Tax=Polaromonas sp. TaxID=1869339 RepID=UPI0025D14E4F|nr:helix-turn-helix domain-containing protein [Polaromonas sp.]